MKTQLLAPLQIPTHKSCRNCGECCGVIPAFSSETAKIHDYLKENPKVRDLAREQGKNLNQCPFRDSTMGNCAIYPVRPVVCRLMGVCNGMTCKHGNSASIDGKPFVDDVETNTMEVLNLIDW